MTDRLSASEVAARSERNRASWKALKTASGAKTTSRHTRSPSRTQPTPLDSRNRGIPEASEHAIQAAAVKFWELWASANGVDPRCLYAIPNAGAGAQRGQAGKMKAEGVRRGWPDLGLDLACGGFHGLRIEVKRKGWTPPKSGKALEHWQNQQSIHAMLRRNNYNVIVAVGYDEIIRALCAYVSGR